MSTSSDSLSPSIVTRMNSGPGLKSTFRFRSRYPNRSGSRRSVDTSFFSNAVRARLRTSRCLITAACMFLYVTNSTLFSLVGVMRAGGWDETRNTATPVSLGSGRKNHTQAAAPPAKRKTSRTTIGWRRIACQIIWTFTPPALPGGGAYPSPVVTLLLLTVHPHEASRSVRRCESSCPRSAVGAARPGFLDYDAAQNLQFPKKQQ